MRFYTKQHKYCCGIDLHARSMYICILNEEGKTALHKNRKASPDASLRAIAPYREDVVVAVEYMMDTFFAQPDSIPRMLLAP